MPFVCNWISVQNEHISTEQRTNENLIWTTKELQNNIFHVVQHFLLLHCCDCVSATFFNPPICFQIQHSFIRLRVSERIVKVFIFIRNKNHFLADTRVCARRIGIYLNRNYRWHCLWTIRQHKLNKFAKKLYVWLLHTNQLHDFPTLHSRTKCRCVIFKRFHNPFVSMFIAILTNRSLPDPNDAHISCCGIVRFVPQNSCRFFSW